MTGDALVEMRRLFRVVNGGTPTSDPDNWDGGVQRATPIDLGGCDGGTLQSTQRTLSVEGLRSGSAEVPAGSLILSSRAPIGYVAQSAMRSAFNQGCKGLIPRKEVDARFYRYVLSSSKAALTAAGQGSTFVELSSEAVASFRVPHPPIKEQRTIASFLDTETARIDALINKKQDLARLVRARTAARISGLFEPSIGEPARLGYFVISLTQGSSPQAGQRPAQAGELGLLKLSAVKAGAFQATENKVLAADAVANPLHPHRGDLLVTRANTPAYVGDSCAVTADYPQLVICDLIYRLRLSPSLNPEFAALCLQEPGARAHLTSLARGTSQSMVKLRGEDIRSVRIPIPELGVQQTLVKRARGVRVRGEGIQARLEKQVALLREHRRALITAAVAGALEIPGVAS